VDLSDLLIFKTVADEGGILRAAKRLHRVQSNVTTRIKQLEESLGVQLFHREKQRLFLSSDGDLLLIYADRLLRLAEEAKGAVTSGTPKGVLRLGALESTAASRLPEIFCEFHRQFPEVRVELKTSTNDGLVAALADRRLDAAFVAEAPRSRDVAHMPLFSERLVVISSLTHSPIAKPADVAGDSVIAFPSGCAYRRVLERWLGGKSLAHVRVLELSSYHAIVACVAAGTGIALVPESVLDTVQNLQVARYSLPRVLGHVVTPMIWRAADQSAAVTALRRVVQQLCRPSPRAQRLRAPVLARSRRL
jgi:DNA-binding transcriptional LysR family regulator